MKKNSSLRLKLHRETLRALDGSEAEAARGGTLAACISAVISACGSCVTCGPRGCPTLVQNCTALC